GRGRGRSVLHGPLSRRAAERRQQVGQGRCEVTVADTRTNGLRAEAIFICAARSAPSIAPPLGPHQRVQRGCGASAGLSRSESGSVSSTIAATTINAVGTPSASPATP